jgi:hypothetical protein
MKSKKTTTSKKALPKAQLGSGSGFLGLPNFKERQERKIARAERKADVADLEGYDSVADKKEAKAGNLSRILGTARSKVKSVFGNNNNVANTVDSYNKGSYNKGSFNRPQSIMQSQPTGFTSPDAIPGNTTKTAPKDPYAGKPYGPPRFMKKGGVAKKKK